MDLNDIHRDAGSDAVRSAFDRATRTPRSSGSGEATKVTTTFTNTRDILLATYPPLSWAVDGYVAEGFSVLAGRQKLGKSRMALDFAVAIAAGGVALGKIQCRPGDVLYIDLENGPRRVQRRVLEMLPYEQVRPSLERLNWTFEAPQIGDKFFRMLDDWREGVPDPRLVVIDVLQRVKPPGKSSNQNAYERDYDCFSELQSWATRHAIAVLALHHTRKGGADDPLEALSGSNGLSAVADTTLVLDRDSQGTTLYVRGRDVEERDSALTSVNGLWHLQGDAVATRRSAQRSAILEALRESSEPLSPREVSDITGGSQASVRQMLTRMAKGGEVERVGRGLYQAPCHIGHNRHDAPDEDQTGTEPVGGPPEEDVTEACDIEPSRNVHGHDGENAGAMPAFEGDRPSVTRPADVTAVHRDNCISDTASPAAGVQAFRGDPASASPDVTVVTDVTAPSTGSSS